MTISKSVRPQLSDEAASYVRGLIISGGIVPGTPIRPEVLAETLGISTTPVREALQSLRVEGFLDLLPRKGFMVAALSGDDIRDIFQVQALISGELAARAALRATDSELAELEALHYELIAAETRKDAAGVELKNHAFHRSINLMAGSRKIVWVISLISRYVPRSFYINIPGWREASVSDHGAILVALQTRNPDLARRTMEVHTIHAGEILAEHFDARVQEAQ